MPNRTDFQGGSPGPELGLPEANGPKAATKSRLAYTDNGLLVGKHQQQG